MPIEYSCSTVRTPEKAVIAEIGYEPPCADVRVNIPEHWTVWVTTIDDECMMSHGEFLDTKGEALAYVESVDADITVIASKRHGHLFGDGCLVKRSREMPDCTYVDSARKMDVKAYADGHLEIYSDMAYDGANARRVRLTKEQAMWLAEFLPKAIASMPYYGWEGNVVDEIAERGKEDD